MIVNRERLYADHMLPSFTDPELYHPSPLSDEIPQNRRVLSDIVISPDDGDYA